jgi:hypothetical protein
VLTILENTKKLSNGQAVSTSLMLLSSAECFRTLVEANEDFVLATFVRMSSSLSACYL